MGKFTKSVDIWALSPEERARLQPGQYVTAGPNGSRGIFLGERPGCTVVAWLDNARANAKSHAKGGSGLPYKAYIAKLREYAKA